MNARAGERLSVYLHGGFVGELERRGPSRYRYSYATGVVNGGIEGEIVLSASLPLRSSTFLPAGSAPFFEGLLPEGAVRAAVAGSLHISEDDGFGLLAAIGADCAGAVSVLLPEHKPAAPGEGRLRRLSEAQLLRLIEDLPRNPLGIDPRPEGVRLSLGGVQHKLVLASLDSGGFAQPLDGAPSDCLLKPESRQYENLVVNEYFCMRVADSVGLTVARTDLIEIGDIPCLNVTRFDRVKDEEERTFRIHQEDLCQALGLLPAAKYEENGGPSIAAVVSLLRAVRGPEMARDINDFVHMAMVNFLIGNSDAHGKNFALLHEAATGPRMAPFYDIVSTGIYSDVTDQMAMAIGGITDPTQIDSFAWARLGEECGFGRGLLTLLRRRAAAVLRAAEMWQGIAIREGWHRPAIDSIVELCRGRAKLVIDGP